MIRLARFLCGVAILTSAAVSAGSPGSSGASAWSFHLGPLHVGMAESELVTRFGAGTKRMRWNGKDYAVYVFPDDLHAKLARQPITANTLKYSTLVVFLDMHRVAGYSLTAGSIETVPRALKVFPLNASIGRVQREYGRPSRWNNAHDEAFFDPRPLSFSVDDAGHVFAVTTGRSIADQQDIPAVALKLHKQSGSNLVNGFDVSSPG